MTKLMTAKEIMGMTVNVNNEVKALTSFVTDTQYIDTDVKVTEDNAFPKKAVGDALHPVYYVCKLAINLAKDVKNVTTGSKEEKIAKNTEILKNATGFKAVCRDLTTLAGKTEKGFLKMTACMPCPVEVNPNGCISNLWVFTSKDLREKFLRMVQNGINNGKYHVASDKAKTKELKKVKDIALCMDISYEEAYKIAVKKGIVKEK